MEFRVLGPFEVSYRGRKLVLGGKQRTLLAVLLLHADEVVSSERLIDALWAERPPETAQTALQVHVSQLRKLLGPDRIETAAPGYRLRVGAEEFDAAQFEALLSTGCVAEALALWRGPALADFRYESWAQGEIARLEELRANALEKRIDTDLAAGRHVQLVAELEALVCEQPLRERSRAQLMLALYRCNRQAEALDVYQQTRALLVEELGIEPGDELKQLHMQILNHDPALAAPPMSDEPEPPAAPREERKVVTALFCDLVGFTVRGEQVDPEDLSALLTQYHLRLRAELERRGGTVEKFVGDAVLALFGAPVAHEDDPERALQAAFAIRDWIAEQDEDLQVRIGIATGEALVRLDANAAEGEAMAVGDVINTAARLQQTAPAGAIVVGESTHRATRDVIAYEQLEPVELKGKAQPVRVWVAREPVQSGGMLGDRPSTPFIGREADLALLVQSYARALRESSVQLVTIVGEPGIGKTRLVNEFRTHVYNQPDEVLWRQGRCLAYGDGITFWALGEAVKQHAGILESDPPDAASSKLAGAIEAVAEPADHAWLRATLAPLVGIAPSEQSIQPEEAFAAWRTFLEDVAAQQPLVLVIEDLHWADSALLGFVDHLVDYAADVPLLVVATARPELQERAPEWGGGKRNSTTISLAPLTNDDICRLISALLARATLPGETNETVLERAGGNPLYTEEFVRMLGDRGLLTTRDGMVEVRDDAEIPLPDSIHAVIAARIDTLSSDRKALLHDAAVVGKVFWAGALAAIGRMSKEAVLAGLHELAHREFIRRARRSSIADDVEYTFWHVLVRDVAYSEIPRAARARKHVAAAEWIERISGERVTDHAEFLANHYATALELTRAAGEEVGPLIDAAVRFGTLAAQRAFRLDPPQGERYYRRTLAVLPEDDPRWAKLLADAAYAGVQSGVPAEQTRRELERAIRELRAQGEVLAAANAIWQLSNLLRAQEESLTLAHEARRLLEPLPPGPELAQVYDRLSQEHVLARECREAIEWGEKALPLFERFGMEQDTRFLRSRILGSRAELGDQNALDALRRLTREAGDPELGGGPYVLMSCSNNLGYAELMAGSGPAAAAKHGRAACDVGTKYGFVRSTNFVKSGLAEALYDLGEWDETLQINDEIAEWEDRYGHSMIGVAAATYAAKILVARGELNAAAELIENCLPRARAVRGANHRLPVLAAAAMLAASRDDASGAADLVDEYMRDKIIAASPATWTAIARLCASMGQLHTLERLAETLPDGPPALAQFVQAVRAIFAEAVGRYEVAEAEYARIDALWQQQQYVVEHAHTLFGLGRSRLALGKPSDAPAPLREARAIFESLGARPLVAETDELLAEAAAVRSS